MLKMEEGSRTPPSRHHTNQPSSADWFKRRQRAALSGGQHGTGATSPSRFQQPRGSSAFQTEPVQKGYTFEQSGKPSKPRPESAPHDKRINRSSDTTKKGYRGNRPFRKPIERPKSAATISSTFEVKLSDFPELGGINPSKTKVAFSQQPRSCWDSDSPMACLDSAATISKGISGNKGSKQKSVQQVSTSEKPDSAPAISPGRDKGLVLPNPYGSPVASWANIASQPPKVIPKPSAAHNTSSQDEASPLQPEQSAKKKKRKKKKKSTAEAEEDATENVALIQQELPKFEDEEEFPDLSLAFVNPPKAQRLPSTPAIKVRESSALQAESVNKSKATAGKSGATDSKKTQPQGQKKSKAPVQLDLGNIMEVLEQKQQSQKSKQDQKPVTLSVSGALPVVPKEPSSQKKNPRQQERIAHNPLDSTSPLVKKGKQREVPKAKKTTALKRVILKEREERKRTRLSEERDPAWVSSEAGQAEPQPGENLSETSSEQPCAECTNEYSSDVAADEPNLPGSPDSSMENIMDENMPSKCIIPVASPNRPKIHSRKFRDYCCQMLSKDVDECVTALLKELVRFQDRLYQKDPMKARMKRRLVMGLREVLKHLKLRKVKCVIISPNCERIQSKGGLDEALHTIIDTCREQGVPFVFALSRKSLGRCVSKAVPVSLVGIFNYDGAQDHYHKMIELTAEARNAYEVMIANLEVTSEEQEEEKDADPSPEPPAAEEPEYIKVWKRMLEKDYNHKFLALEEQFSAVSISTEPDTLPDDADRS